MMPGRRRPGILWQHPASHQPRRTIAYCLSWIISWMLPRSQSPETELTMRINNTILSITFSLIAATSPSGAQTIHAYAGIPEPGFSGDGGPAKSAQLNAPGSLAIDGAGGLYIVDSNNVRIRRVTAN